jgi:hypothetical protein
LESDRFLQLPKNKNSSHMIKTVLINYLVNLFVLASFIAV